MFEKKIKPKIDRTKKLKNTNERTKKREASERYAFFFDRYRLILYYFFLSSS